MKLLSSPNKLITRQDELKNNEIGWEFGTYEGPERCVQDFG